MREHRKIVERWHQESALILATLIRVEGSSYRRPGARLVVCKDGSYEGSISAGCLEADLLRKAAWLIRYGSTIERYSTLFDEETEIPFGLGCGGVLDVLLESVETPECRALLQAIESTVSGCEHLVATWIPTDDRSMMRAIFRADGELIFSSSGLSGELLSCARVRCMRNADSSFDEMFVERLVPPQRLFIFGAGDDSKPLVTMACLLGWKVVVTDGRTHLAQKSRFAENTAEVVSTPSSVMQRINRRDAVVIMTHSYWQDREYLESLLSLRPTYLGILGSRRRSSLLIAHAATKLNLSVSECCKRICAPIGLDIGGEGPEAIALAIIAEAQACCTGSPRVSRKLSAEHVHRYLETSDPRQFERDLCGLEMI